MSSRRRRVAMSTRRDHAEGSADVTLSTRTLLPVRFCGLRRSGLVAVPLHPLSGCRVEELADNFAWAFARNLDLLWQHETTFARENYRWGSSHEASLVDAEWTMKSCHQGSTSPLISPSCLRGPRRVCH